MPSAISRFAQDAQLACQSAALKEELEYWDYSRVTVAAASKPFGPQVSTKCSGRKWAV